MSSESKQPMSSPRDEADRQVHAPSDRGAERMRPEAVLGERFSAHPPAPEPDTGAEEAVAEEELSAVPMLEDPEHLPVRGQRSHLSPLAHFALSRVTPLPVDVEDEGLWLHEEPCPAVTDIGITLHGRPFFHHELQHLVAGLPGTARKSLVVRYNRALLARGVLQEVIVGERDAAGRFLEHVRCRPREQVLREVDLNIVLRHRAHFRKVLEAKVATALHDRVTHEHGTRAMEQLRDEQAARRRRQRHARPAPIVAQPITAMTPREQEAHAAAERMQELASQITPGADSEQHQAEELATSAGRATPRPNLTPDSARPGVSGGEEGREARSPETAGRPAKAKQPGKGEKPRRTNKAVNTRGEGLARGRQDSQRVKRGGHMANPATPTPAPAPGTPLSLEQALGGTTGFVSTEDD